MRVNKYLLPILILISMLGAVGIARLTGDWAVTGKGQVDIGNLTSEDIRGWMTLQQIADGFSISLDSLYSLLDLPAHLPPTTALKDLENIIPGFEISTVKDALESSSTPQPATQEPTLTPSQMPVEVLETPLPEEHQPQDSIGGGPTPLPADYFLAASEIKGRTTLKELIENGKIPRDDLLEALDLPLDFDLNTSAKDLVGKGSVTSVEYLREVVAGLQER